MSAAIAGGVDRARFPYKMKDLCELTGLDRQAIHFYIQQGLVPEGEKTGRNMAYYGPEHLERIRLVRRLQHERFLPLKAIRAVIDGDEGAFTPEQRGLLSELRPRLAAVLGDEGPATATATVPLGPLLAAHDLTRAEAQAIADLGLLALVDAGGEPRIAGRDAWILETWGALRKAGFSRALGFDAADLAIYEDAAARLVDAEVRMLMPRLAHLPADEVAAMVERALPLVSAFVVRLHLAKVRDFFASLA